MDTNASNEVTEDKEVVLKVSSSQEEGYCKKVAGAISWRLRESGFCRLRAIKAEAINSAIKALAIVNGRLGKQTEDKKLVFCFDPIFENVKDDSGKSSLAISMKITEVFEEENPPAEFVEYKVSAKKDENDNNKLAGAISAPVREGKGVRMRCIGKASTYKCICASVLAKGYVYSYGLGAVMVPTWHTIQSDKSETGQISALQIDFWAVPLQDDDNEV